MKPIYAVLVDRMYSIPDSERYHAVLMLTWDEFCQVWFMDDTRRRPPTLADARNILVLGRPICISDASDNWLPPVAADRRGWVYSPGEYLVRLTAPSIA